VEEEAARVESDTDAEVSKPGGDGGEGEDKE
jgi:hypothetical protein